MEARDLAVGLAGGRIAIGIVSLLMPGVVGCAMIGPEGDSGGMRLFLRVVGARPRPRAGCTRQPGPRRARARLAASVGRGGRSRRGGKPARPPPPSPDRVSSRRRRSHGGSAAQRLAGRAARRITRMDRVGPTIVGRRSTPGAGAAPDLLTRNEVPHRWVDLDRDPLVPLLQTESLRARRLPLVLFPDGTQLEGPEDYTGQVSGRTEGVPRERYLASAHWRAEFGRARGP